jgi:small-conductance mechanosensitive channel/CRP-like cAMP-binding protein
MTAGDLPTVIADPIVQAGTLAIVGAVVTRIVLRNHPTRRFVGQTIFFVGLSALLLYHGIVPYRPGPSGVSTLQQIFIGLAKVVWWVNAAWSLISFVRIALIWEGQPREGRLVQDLVVGLIYVGAALSIVAYVFDAPVGTLIATSGVFAIILGLAMQSTLSDVFSGLALNLGRPYVIGDWIVLDGGIEGRVSETNWRAVYLINGGNDLVVVPNSDLAKARLTNITSSERGHGLKVTVRVVPTVSPASILETMHAVLLSSNRILPSPTPTVQVKSLSSASVEVELAFRVSDLSAGGAAQNEVFDLVYRHAFAAGLRLAPENDPAAAAAHDAAQAGEPHGGAMRLLQTVPLFASLTQDEKRTLAAGMSRRTFHKGEVIVAQGAAMESLMIIRSGVAVVERLEGEQKIELDRLAPGDTLGESGLLVGDKETARVSASTFVVVYEIGRTCISPLFHDRPAIADELGATLARRAEHLTQRLGRYGPVAHAEAAPPLVTRIRRFFQITHPENVLPPGL